MSAGTPAPPQKTTAPAGVVPKFSRHLPPPSVAGVDARVRAIAEELRTRGARNPDQLVAVLDRAGRSAASPAPVTLLPATVAEEGAVGLAQAAPVACPQEPFDDHVSITADDPEGARAYVPYKPLGDAYRIASLVSRSDVAARGRAAELLAAAQRLRPEGYDELEALRRHADARSYAAIDDADRRKLMACDDGPASKGFERRVRDVAGQRYHKERIAKRDALLVARFGSPARDLSGPHASTRRASTRRVAAAEEQVEGTTAALDDGGALNVKRMLARRSRGRGDTAACHSDRGRGTHRTLTNTGSHGAAPAGRNEKWR